MTSRSVPTAHGSNSPQASSRSRASRPARRQGLTQPSGSFRPVSVHTHSMQSLQSGPTAFGIMSILQSRGCASTRL